MKNGSGSLSFWAFKLNQSIKGCTKRTQFAPLLPVSILFFIFSLFLFSFPNKDSKALNNKSVKDNWEVYSNGITFPRKERFSKFPYKN